VLSPSSGLRIFCLCMALCFNKSSETWSNPETSHPNYVKFLSRDAVLIHAISCRFDNTGYSVEKIYLVNFSAISLSLLQVKSSLLLACNNYQTRRWNHIILGSFIWKTAKSLYLHSVILLIHTVYTLSNWTE